jgi:UDPglucose 6-dehydrogenase
MEAQMKVRLYGDSLDSLTVAAILADYGNDIYLDPVLSKLEKNEYFDSEPGLFRRFSNNQRSKRIRYSSQEVVDIHWIFSRLSDENCQTLINNIIKNESDTSTIFLSSHHAIGFHKQLLDGLGESFQIPNEKLPNIVMIPFMSREGTAIGDFENPELLVAGSNNADGFRAVYELLGPFIRQSKKFMAVPAETAEMIRSASSAMLATRLSFMNEVACLCEQENIDIEVVKQAMASDSRIGPQYLSPGCGFGGVTLLKELENLRQEFKSGGAGTQLLDAVVTTNNMQKELLFRKFWQYYSADVVGKSVAIWGGAFKSGVSSVENSAIHELLHAFWAQGVTTKVFEPKAASKLHELYGRHKLFELAEDQYLALKDVDGLLIVTDHKQFYSLNFHLAKSMMTEPVIFDGRNIYDLELMQVNGFNYFGIGHGMFLD